MNSITQGGDAFLGEVLLHGRHHVRAATSPLVHLRGPPDDAVVREVHEETGLKATPGGVAGVYSATFPRSEVRPRDSLHFISIVFWLSVAEGPIEHERDGTTDLAAWIALEELGVLPLGAVAKYGLTLLSGRSARS